MTFSTTHSDPRKATGRFLLCTAIVYAAGASAWGFQDRPLGTDLTNKPPAAKPGAPAQKPAAEQKSQILQVQPTQPQQPGAAPTPTVVLKPGEVPKIEMDTPNYNFGRVRSGPDAVVNHDFWFANKGNGPLEILQVKPSCGCTTSGQYDRVVQPGQSGKIPIRLSLAHGVGAINKTVSIVTNCPGDQANITLHLAGELWQTVQATPNMASFGTITPEQANEAPLTRRLVIANNSDSGTMTLTDLKASSPAFKAELKQLEAGKKYEMLVSLAGPLTTGAKAATFTMNTGLKEVPTFSIPANAFVVNEIDVVPNKILVPATRGSVVTRDLYVRNTSKVPLKITDLKVSNPQIKMTLQDTNPGTSARISVEIPVDYKIPDGGDKLTFKTAHPRFPLVEVQVGDASALSSVTPGQAGPQAGNFVKVPPTAVNAPVVQGQLAPGGKPSGSTASVKTGK